MLEKIYTIPVNEAFDQCRGNEAEGCPFCKLYRRLENDEIEIILGASMMEPDIRIQTNRLGFCGRHFDIMFDVTKVTLYSSLSHNLSSCCSEFEEAYREESK